MIYIAGPGHGGPGIVANTYLEGTYSEVYPNISQDEEGIESCSGSSPFPAASRATWRRRRPARSTKAASSATALSHAYGAAFDNPDLIVACVVGDGEAETGPLATALAFEQVSQPGARRRGAADPASERLQDRQSDDARAHQHDELEQLVPRLRLHALFRRGRRAGGDASGDGGDARTVCRRDPRDPGRRARATASSNGRAGR